ncbi:MAG: AgmX/PglI C-terminal domain-containing protein [bacterium]
MLSPDLRRSRPDDFRLQFHTMEFAYEDRVFGAIFLTVLLIGIAFSLIIQQVHVHRTVFVPVPEARKVTEIILREPEPAKPPEKIAKKPEPPRQLTKEEKKKLTSPPPLSAVGSPKAVPQEQPVDVKKLVARKGLLGLVSKESGDTQLRAYTPSKKRDVSEDLDKALKNLSQNKNTGKGDDDFLGVGNLPDVAKKGTDIGYILNASKIGEVKETQVEFYGGTEDLPERILKDKAPDTEGQIRGGGRSPYEIRKIVASYLGGLRYLYNKELRKDPDLQGKMTVSFDISPSGQVTFTSMLSSSLGSASLEQAVLANILKWRFPTISAENGNTKVTWPFVFVPPAS